MIRERIGMAAAGLALSLLLTINAPAAEPLAQQVEAAGTGARETTGGDAVVFPGWFIDLSAGYSLTRGNSDTQDFLARAAAMKKFEEPWELIVKGEYAWGKVKDRDTGEYEQTADRGLISGQGNFFLIEDGFLYGRSEISYDKVKQLDRRIESGAGIGYDFYRRERAAAGGEAGVSYIDSRFDDDTGQGRLYLRLAQKCSIKINENVSLLESVEYKPQFDDFNDYLINGDVSLKVNLTGNLFFMFSVNDSYENNPAAGSERNDLRVISSLGISL